MKDYMRKKTESNMLLKKIICLLMAAVLILPLTGTGFTRTYADNPTNAPVYEGNGWYSWVVPDMEEHSLSIDFDLQEYDDDDVVNFYDLPIVDTAEWQYDDFASDTDIFARLNTSVLTMTVSHQLNPSTNALSLTGHITNTGGATVTWRGFWLRRHDIADVREISGGGGNVAFHSPQIGGLTPGQRYLFRVVARTTCYANIHQGPAGEVTIPGSQSPSTPPPGGGPTPTPTPTSPPGGGPTSTPPPSGPTPTPTPSPTLSFSPSNVAPWDSREWVSIAGGSTVTAVVHASQNWSATQTHGDTGWLTISGTGMPGTPLSIRTNPNHSGVRRTARITVRSGDLTRTLDIAQSPIFTSIRGLRVMERYGRRGYVDVSGAATNTTISAAGSASVRRPLWNFVHLFDNQFAIRNDETGHYFTETSGSLRHQASISGNPRNPDPRQRWILARQPNGTYRIRSVSNNELYVTDGVLNLTLARANTGNSQLWQIGFMWHVHNRYTAMDGGVFNWVGFWPGNVNIHVRAVGPQPSGFNFGAVMNIARSAWSDALGIEFHSTGTATANIKAYGGNRFAIQRSIENTAPLVHRYGVVRMAHAIDYSSSVTIQAGGAARPVYRLNGIGNTAVLLYVLSDNEDPNTDVADRDEYASDGRNIRFSTMVTIHELGHALGYSGHAPNTDDVMRGDIPAHMLSPNVRLTPAEIAHLRQIYRNFR